MKNMYADIASYINNSEDYPSYIQMMEQNSGSEYFNEIVAYMTQKHPDWNTQAGTGTTAPEFVMNLIENFESYITISEKTGKISKRNLQVMQQEMDELYPKFKFNYTAYFQQWVRIQFDNFLADEASFENGILTQDELDAMDEPTYNQLFELFYEQARAVIPYNFTDDYII